ncbi:MAG: MerR family DNA-binding protein [Reyranella sp.]|uniref:MerR family transcriptional regulator n=1 Tax=Reyranella sp. TaxID=1929291 RepID=UPI001AD2DCAA|nr:MerR family transcriptional regulator [Reyranella sp.]MBN9088068.1 MerR family DNA-binding protein [Reyranella sp.]
MGSGTFTVGQLARAAGLDIDDVQSLRARGVLQPPRRQRGRTDDVAYHHEHLDRLKFIKHALACGFTLEDIAELVNPGALVTCGDVRALTQRRLEQVREAGGTDAVVVARLEKLREACAGAGSRRECSILEALSAEER